MVVSHTRYANFEPWHSSKCKFETKCMLYAIQLCIFIGSNYSLFVRYYFISMTTTLLIYLFLLFSKGCFFTSSGGLRSYEHPFNEVKPVPRVDSSGQVCGVTFTVDEESKRETVGMPRVGSAANWSSNY